MASKITLKNLEQQEFTIQHPDGVGAGTINSTDITYKIDSVDDFASVPSASDTVIVKDKDRGGVFNKIASTTANNGTIFDGDGCSWERQYSGSVNVKWFGAVGDWNYGTSTGTDDTLAIQAAIDSGAAVFFPDGDYRITAALELSNGSRLLGSANSDIGAAIVADVCDAIHITAKDTTIENLRFYMDDTYWAFTYDKPTGQDSSFNNINRANYVNGGNAFKLLHFSRSFIHNFNSNNLDRGIYLNGYSQNSTISDSLFQGHNSSINNVNGEYGFKADVGSVSMEGIAVKGCKFISFYDGVINYGLRYSVFSDCVFDVITRYGYQNSGFNKDITFVNCYFASNWEESRGDFPTFYGYKAFIHFIPLSGDEPNLGQDFINCYFVGYNSSRFPQVIANIDLYNGGISFIGCEDAMSEFYSIALVYPNKNCIIKDNKRFKDIVSNASYSATPIHNFDPSNRLDVKIRTGLQELSINREVLYSSLTGVSSSGTLTSKIMNVDSADGNLPKVFKVFVREGGPGSSFIDVKEYLVIMSYRADASTNDGIQLVATSPLWNGTINRVSLALTSTAASTEKTMTFTWSSDTVVEISIERIM